MTREHAEREREAFIAFCNGLAIQVRKTSEPELGWCDSLDPLFRFDLEHRIKPPSPAPKRVPLEPQDIPPVCWLLASDSSWPWLVLMVAPVMVCGHSHSVTFDDLMLSGWQFSTDRKTWRPCWKEATI